jgi:enoyl-CoA hydratase/carnithine racemase
MFYTPEQVSELSNHSFAHLLVRQDGPVLHLRLNRPDKKNAINPVLLRELAFGLSYAHHMPEVWAVVISAEGDTFCAGYDLRTFAGAESTGPQSTIPDPPGDILTGELFHRLHKPALAKVQGPAYAGAFLVICGCTHVIAADHATFQLPEVKRGLWPMQVMASLLHLMPARKALDLCMRAKKLTAEEALAFGIVTDVVPAAELDAAANKWIAEITSLSPTAIRLGLTAYDELRTVAGHEEHAFLRTRLAEMLGTEDAREGLAAFAEKRAPKWTGR